MLIDSFSALVSEIKLKTSNQTTPCLIAIDGRSGTGKSTLSKRLGQELGASIVNGDDFYSGGQLAEWAYRTPQDKVDYCMDWQRMRKEALEPLLRGHSAKWRTFNWNTGVGLSEQFVIRRQTAVVIVDGTFSTRKELSDIVNISVLLRLPEDIRRQRLDQREGKEFMDKWHAVWDECEDYYFKKLRTVDGVDIVIADSSRLEA